MCCLEGCTIVIFVPSLGNVCSKNPLLYHALVSLPAGNSSLPQFINIAIDSGSRVTIEEFEEQLEFAKQIIDDLPVKVGGIRGSRVAITAFGSSAETVIDTDQMTHVTTPSLRAAISQLAYIDRGDEDLTNVLLEAANLQPPAPPTYPPTALPFTTGPFFPTTSEYEYNGTVNGSSADIANGSYSTYPTFSPTPTIIPITSAAAASSIYPTAMYVTGTSGNYSIVNASYSHNMSNNATSYTSAYSTAWWSSTTAAYTTSIEKFSIDYEPPVLLVLSRATTSVTSNAIQASASLQTSGYTIQSFSCGALEKYDLVTFGESETAPAILTIASQPISENGYTLTSFAELSTVAKTLNVSTSKLACPSCTHMSFQTSSLPTSKLADYSRYFRQSRHGRRAVAVISTLRYTGHC